MRKTVKIESLMKNEILAREFVNLIFLPLKDDEVFIYMILARKKYNPIVSNECLFHRDLLEKNDPDYIVKKIKKNCLMDNTFTDPKTNAIIPIDSFVVYVDLSPKSVLKAYGSFVKRFNDLIYQSIKNILYLPEVTKIKSILLSEIHKSDSYKPYILVDVDKKDVSFLLKIKERLKIKWISETRGGYHILIENNRENGRIVHMEFSHIPNIEIKKEVMTPLPGTLQGGFEVKKYE